MHLPAHRTAPDCVYELVCAVRCCLNLASRRLGVAASECMSVPELFAGHVVVALYRLGLNLNPLSFFSLGRDFSILAFYSPLLL